jgi:phage gp36-like protein
VAVYVSPAELRASLARDPQHPEGTAADLGDPHLQWAIDAAQGQVDSRLQVRYPTPFGEPVPPLVKSITTAIAGYLADLGYRQSVDSNSQDPVAKRYQWAIDMLSRLVNGSASLPGVATSVGAFPVNPYEGELFGLEHFDLVIADSGWTPPPGTWQGPWDG